MATFYLDPVNGNDANNGTTWALARRSMTAAGWQSFPGLTGSDTINVAKSPDPVPAGQVTVTNGSKQVDFVDAPVTTIFDRWGGPGAAPGGAITAVRNTYIGGGTGDFALSGVATSGTRSLFLARPATTTTSYTVLGALTFAPVTFSAADTHYVGIKFKGARDYGLKLALTFKSTAETDVRLYNTSDTTSQADIDAKRARASNVVTTSGVAATSQPVAVGGSLFSATSEEYIGSNDMLFFPVPAGMTTIAGIGFLVTGATSGNSVEGVYFISTLGARLPANAQPVNPKTQNRVHGLNVVVGTAQLLQQAESFAVLETSSTTRAPSKFSANLTHNWARDTATTAGLVAVTTQISGSTILSAGGGSSLKVRGGVNPANDVQDGITRVSSLPPTATSTANSTSNFELYLRDAVFSGFSTYNFNIGLYLKLNSTRNNVTYTFEDIAGNATGYNFYSDNSTCPTNIVVNARNFAPNTTVSNTSGMPAGCTGYSVNQVAPVIINAMSWGTVTNISMIGMTAAFGTNRPFTSTTVSSTEFNATVTKAPAAALAFFIDPTNGNDANDGLSWNSARKTMTVAGWQSLPGLAGNSSIYVAKSPDPTSAGLLTFTNGQKTVNLSSNPANTIFNTAGDWTYPSLPPRLYPQNSLLSLTGSQGSYALAASAVWPSTTNAGAYTYIGAYEVTRSLENTGITFPANTADFIAVRVTGRSATASLAIGFNATGNNAKPADAKGAETITVLQANVTYDQPAVVGGALYSVNREEKIGNVDTLFFRVPSGVTGIETLSFFARDTSSTSNFVIQSIALVSNIDDTLPNAEPNSPPQFGRAAGKGLNMVIGALDPDLTKMQLSGFGLVTDPATTMERMHGFMTFNWPYATMTRTNGVVALTHQIDYNVFLSAGSSGGLSFTVQGGVDMDSGQIDGVTRLSGAFSTSTSVAPGPHNFELFLRNGRFSGFSTHNFAQGVRLKLNSTRVNQNYTFDDIQGNNYGSYLFSDDATCPSRVFLHYKNFGPNNALLKDATITACAGFSEAKTKAMNVTATSSAKFSLFIGLGVPNYMVWNVPVTTTSNFRLVYPRPILWTGISAASNVTVAPLTRNRGYRFTVPNTITVQETLSRLTTRATWSSATASSATEKLNTTLRMSFSATGESGSAFDNFVAKGFAWNVTSVTDSALILSTNVPLGWNLGAGTTTAFGDIDRVRGYRWSVPGVVSIDQNLTAARTTGYAVNVTPVVLEKLSRGYNQDFTLSAATTVEGTQAVARRENSLVQATSTSSTALSRQTTVSMNVSATSSTAIANSRVRDVTFASTTTSATDFKPTRIKVFDFVVDTASTAAFRAGRAFRSGWASLTEATMYLDQGKTFRFKSQTTSTSTFATNRARTVSFGASGTSASTSTLSKLRDAGFTVVSTTATDFSGFTRNRRVSYSTNVAGSITFDPYVEGRLNTFISGATAMTFTLNQLRNGDFSVASESASQMSINYNKRLDYSLDAYVTVDTSFTRAQVTDVEDFGAESAADFVFGIGRGVKSEIEATADAVLAFSREISLGWSTDITSMFNVSSQPNRLDAFYVEYEAPVTSSSRDGSIVMGERKTSTSGVLHDSRPIFDVVVMPAPTYTITLYEEEEAYEQH